MRKILILLITILLMSNIFTIYYLFHSDLKNIENKEIIEKENVELSKSINSFNSKISTLVEKINQYETRINEMEILITKEKQEELFTISNTTNQYYETMPLLNTPSIRLSFNNVTLPERIRVYQTVDGKTVNIVYQNENIIEILESFTMIKMPNSTENAVVFEKGEYGIIKNEKLTLDLINSDDIDYVTKYRDIVNKIELDLKLHYEVVIDGVEQD